MSDLRLLFRMIVLRTCCLPADILGFIAVAMIALSTGLDGDFSADRGCFVWRQSRHSWFAKHVRYSLAFGHCLIMTPMAGDVTLEHERRHARQSEIAGVLWSALIMVTQHPVLLALWPMSWVIFYWANALASWLAGDGWYRNNVLEQDARAEAELLTGGES